jgi:hypothetical protein
VIGEARDSEVGLVNLRDRIELEAAQLLLDARDLRVDSIETRLNMIEPRIRLRAHHAQLLQDQIGRLGGGLGHWRLLATIIARREYFFESRIAASGIRLRSVSRHRCLPRKFHVEPRDERGRDGLDFDGRADITS